MRLNDINTAAQRSKIDAPWLKSYGPLVPASINDQLDDYQSINAYIDDCFLRYSQRVAFENVGSTLGYAQMRDYVRNTASWLRNQGVVKGDRVAIMLPNSLQYPVLVFAALSVGAIVVNVNPLYTASELGHVLEDSEPKVIFAFEAFAHTLEAATKTFAVEHVVLSLLGDLFAPRLNIKGRFVNRVLKFKMVQKYHLPNAQQLRHVVFGRHPKQNTINDPCTLEDTAFLQYTGGTTGKAKGAILSHRNVLANCLQIRAWFSGQWQESDIETTVSPLPLYHIYSLVVNCLIFMGLGGHNILITNPRDAKRALGMIKRSKFTGLSAVNTLFQNFLNSPAIDDVDFSHLKVTISGGAALQASVAKAWHAKTGCVIVEGYGLTECSPIVSLPPIDLSQEQPVFRDNVGLPLPSTEVIVRTDDGRVGAIGEVGELCVRGPQVMKGYWKNQEETDLVLDSEGWLCTGDVAVIDAQGFIKIVDRKKDMILVSGFNVYPNEVEDVLSNHPQIIECAVVGTEHPATGEAVKAYIYSESSALTLSAVREYCREFLTGYKTPTQIEVRNEPLPKTPVGKILRKELRAQNTNKTGNL